MPQPAVILLTGFEPFGGEAINPSWEVARALDGELVAGSRVVARELPCRFGAAGEAMRQLVAELRPVCVLALGQASGRADFSIERVAINVDDARIPDNGGAQPIDEPVVAEGPAGYFATLPIKAMVAGLRAEGLPASVSQTAGTFVCNHVFYSLMHSLRQHPDVRAGFMHLPLLPAQASRHPGLPCMPLPLMIEGVRQSLHIAATHHGRDTVQAEGQVA
ncbi:pyroglutamyl-peptidase I [Ideonella sp. DXS29W]|uniref:Pyrrolidone-carboxylate peptidase n=1 Tax=Ideonella lacteola TaxID=2984193 RepID=A0ABU9BIQ8_9BURK